MGESKKEQRPITTYHQIDYIMMQQNRKHILRDARSYKGTQVASDHRVVVSRMDIELYRVYKRKINKSDSKKINSNQLRNDEKRTVYHQEISNNLKNVSLNQKVGQKWNQIKDVIIKSAEKSVGLCERNKKTNGKISNPVVEELSKNRSSLE